MKPLLRCVFCENLGIKLPHDHTIRNFKLKDQPIICPKLLKTKCQYCYKLGHSKFYCDILKKKREKKYINEKKRENPYLTFEDNKRVKDSLLTSFLAGLSIDEEEEDREDREEREDDREKKPVNFKRSLILINNECSECSECSEYSVNKKLCK